MIKAEAHSDDHTMQVRFDATPWFRTASVASIVALADCGWGGDYPADEVAIALADSNRELRRLFSYIELIANDRSKKDVKGFECHISEKDAMVWLNRWNFKAWKAITTEQQTPAPDKPCPGCTRMLRFNVIECGACGHEFTVPEVLKAIYQL